MPASPITAKRWPQDVGISDEVFPLRLLTVLGSLILAGFALRVWHLDTQSLWWDEGVSLYLAKQSLGAILVNRAADVHPPLYFLLLAGWTRAAGASDFAARYLSVLAGVLLVPVAYRLAYRLFDRTTGWIAALLVATSPVLVWYGQEARMYALLALEYLALIALFHRLTDSEGGWASRSAWVAFALVELAALHTHYFAAFSVAWLLLGLLIWGLVGRNTRHTSRLKSQASRLKPLILTQIAVVLAYLPWLLLVLSRHRGYATLGTTPPSPPTAFLQIWHSYNAGSLALVGHHTLFTALSTAAGVLFVIALIAALFWGLRRRALLWLLGHVLVPLTAVLALMQIRPSFHPRYVVMLAPALLLVFARTIALFIAHRFRFFVSRIVHAGSSLASIGLLLILAATFTTAIYAFNTDSQYQRNDVRGLAERLTEIAGPEDVIIFGYLDYPFQRYYDGPAPATYLDLSQSDDAVAHKLSEDLDGRDRAFLVTWNQAPVDRRGLLRWLLTSAGRLVEEQPWGDLKIHTYALDGPVPTPDFAPRTADFGAVRLTGAALPASMPAAGAVPVATAWTTSEAPLADYKVALRLRDRAGHILGQTDTLLVNRAGELTTRWAAGTETTNYTAILLPSGTPPGGYNVDLVVYNATTLQRLDRKDVPRQRLDLGTVRLTPSNASFKAANLPGSMAVTAAMGHLALESYMLDRSEAGPGGRLATALRWRVVGASPDDVPALRLVARDAVLANASAPLYPVSAWMPGDVILDWRDLTVPPDAPAGPAKLQVMVGGTKQELAQVTITSVDHLFEPPTVDYSLDAQFGSVAELLGYDLDTSVQAGETVELTLYWRALGASDVGYTVFAHLLDEAGRLVGQHDGVPAGGQRPTTGWLDGEIIVDRHRMTFKDVGYTGVTQVEIGLYDPDTGGRLSTAEGLDHVILPTAVEIVR